MSCALLRTTPANPFKPAVFFLAGVAYDTLTLTRHGSIAGESGPTYLYLSVLGVLFIVKGRSDICALPADAPNWRGGLLRHISRLRPYYPMAIQFLLGGLFSDVRDLLFTKRLVDARAIFL